MWDRIGMWATASSSTHLYVHILGIIVSPPMYLGRRTLYRLKLLVWCGEDGKIWNPEDHIQNSSHCRLHRVEQRIYVLLYIYYLNIRTKGKSFILIFLVCSTYIYDIACENRYDNISCQSSFRKLVINHFSKYNFSNLCCLLAMRNDDICTLPPPMMTVSWTAAFCSAATMPLRAFWTRAVLGGCFALPYL